MVVLFQMLAELVEDFHDDLTNGQAGTDGTTLFAKTQTGLQTAVGASDVALVDKTFTSTTVSANHLLNTSTATGNTFAEFEVNNGSVSYNRAVKAGISHETTDELNVFHTFDFEIVVF